MHIAIFAGKGKVLLFKPRLFLIKITVIQYCIWRLILMLKVLKQAKENQDCEEYNFIFGIFVVVQIFLKTVGFLLPLVSSGDKT